MKSRLLLCALLFLCLGLTVRTAVARQSAAGAAVVPASGTVPNLINYSGVLKDSSGRTLTSITGVTFLLYKDERGGAPLWLETQNVTPDKTGHYTVQLGAITAKGLPTDLFLTGQGRWLALQIGSEAEQARVLLVAVPYAMKAVDAETLGGLPASAFVLAAPPTGATVGSSASSASAVPAAAPPPTSSNVTTTGGTANRISMFTTATNIQNSILTQTGATAINVLGKLNLPAIGTATSAKGFNSQAQNLVASVFNSGTSTAVPQTFQWQAEPLNNDKTTASGTLNLLFGAGTATPAETGLKISNKGLFTFASGQTFPGAGTITGITTAAGSGLKGGGATGTLGLGLITTCASGQVLKWNGSAWICATAGTGTITGVKAGTGLTGGGTTGIVTLNLDTTKVPLLGAANNFLNNQTVTGTGSGFALVVAPPNAVTGSGLAGSPALEAIGSSADPNGLAAGGVGATVFGGIGGTLNVSGQGGNAINAVGGDSGNGNGGAGLSASGGFGNVGDFVTDGNGGAGVIATGGNSSFLFGGDGIDATGGAGGTGNNFASTAGNGVVGTGGPGGFQEADGSGGFFTGGTAGGFGGFGIEVFAGSDQAGFFSGDITVTGAINAGTKDFKIDHPLDAANKYFYHASVESSEMINIYSGNLTTDGQGEAQVLLPDWFEVVNTDFRYQLTVIGQFAQAIVSSKISNHQFAIKTDKPNVEVSWQVTGVRHDAFAKAHPLVVEREKNQHERGYYLNPELYGAPAERAMAWAHHPGAMKRVAALREQQKKALPERRGQVPLARQPVVNAAAQPNATKP
jgi:trimeric autotransporter adhesin